MTNTAHPPEAKMSDVTVFVCDRGGLKRMKVQLELRPEALEKYKELAKQNGNLTAKQIMENMLSNWVDGVQAAGG
jgi:hypothetical protein